MALLATYPDLTFGKGSLPLPLTQISAFPTSPSLSCCQMALLTTYPDSYWPLGRGYSLSPSPSLVPFPSPSLLVEATLQVAPNRGSSSLKSTSLWTSLTLFLEELEQFLLKIRIPLEKLYTRATSFHISVAFSYIFALLTLSMSQFLKETGYFAFALMSRPYTSSH